MTNTNYKNACAILDDMTDAQAALVANYLIGRLYGRINENDVKHIEEIKARNVQAGETNQ